VPSHGGAVDLFGIDRFESRQANSARGDSLQPSTSLSSSSDMKTSSWQV
jgi:hypothetical protein